jgi:hypothetical protein
VPAHAFDIQHVSYVAWGWPRTGDYPGKASIIGLIKIDKGVSFRRTEGDEESYEADDDVMTNRLALKKYMEESIR